MSLVGYRFIRARAGPSAGKVTQGTAAEAISLRSLLTGKNAFQKCLQETITTVFFVVVTKNGQPRQESCLTAETLAGNMTSFGGSIVRERGVTKASLMAENVFGNTEVSPPGENTL